MKPHVIILTGYGINCEEETAFAFEKAGAQSTIVHVNDLIAGSQKLSDFQILAIPGGFSYGDDTGSGNALANRIRNNLSDQILEFVARDTLTIGICNGCQVLTRLGLVPALEGQKLEPLVCFTHNESARYEDRWVYLKSEKTNCVFTQGLDRISVPVAHGEGRFFAEADILKQLEDNKLVVLRYCHADGQFANGEFPINPNGALHDVAGLTDPTGRILALMPHPERHICFQHHPQWTLLRESLLRQGETLPEDGDGLQIFKNAVQWFS